MLPFIQWIKNVGKLENCAGDTMGKVKRGWGAIMCVGFVGATLLADTNIFTRQSKGEASRIRKDVRREKRFRIMARSAELPGVGAAQSGRGELAALANPPMFNGQVLGAFVYGAKTYAVGSFNKVSEERTGYGIPVNMTNGQPLNNFDPINGYIENVIEDGVGGWYISGDFTRVGATDRAGFAHIFSNGKLDVSWNLNVGAKSWIDKMCLLDGSLYLLVETALSEDTSRLELHSYNTTSRQKTNGWSLFEGDESDRPDIRVVKSSKDRLYFGGLFSSLQGVAKENVAAFDVKSGRVVSGWVGETNSFVLDMLVTEKDLIVGGYFSQANSFNRKGVAAFDLVSGNLTSWDPNLGGSFVSVNTIARISDTLYLGGQFETVGGFSADGFAAVGLADGKNKTHLFGQFDIVTKMTTSGTTIYFSGLRLRNKTTYDHYWAFEQSGTLTGWTPQAVWGEEKMAAGDNAIFLTVNEGFLGGEKRNGLAVFDNATGKIDGFNPAPGNVTAFHLDQDTLYLADWSNRISAINLASQTVGSWLKGTTFDRPVYAITKKGNVVYVGGEFRTVNNIARNGLAAFDSSSGNLLSWAPKVEKKDGSMSVKTLAISGDLILVGGRFETINSQNRENLAAINDKGVLQAWNPSPNDFVSKIVVDGNNTYVGGQFNQITASKYFRKGFAAFDSSSLNILAWDMQLNLSGPYPTVYVSGISAANGHVYVSGNFDHVNNTPVDGVAAFKRSDWSLTSWNPNIGGAEWNHSVTAYSDRVLIGGDFYTANGQIQRGLAVAVAVSSIPEAPVPTSLSTASVQATSVVLEFNPNGNPLGTTFVIQQVASLTGAFQTVKETTVSPVAVSSLSPSTEYYFRVRVKNPDGSLGDPSNVLLVKTGVVMQLLKTQLDKVSDTQVNLSWASVGVKGWTYWVDVATTPANPPIPVKKLFRGEDLSATVGGLTPNMKYFAFVKACQGDRCSDYMAFNPMTTLAKSPRVQVEPKGNEQVILSLLSDANAPGTQYIIERWSESTGVYDVIYTGISKEISVKGLVPGEENRFRATVVDPDGVATEASNEVIYTANGFSVDDVVVYPIPFIAGKGVEMMTFDQMPDDATARIYSTGGTLVKELRGDGEVLWNVRNEDGEPVASGVYFVRVSGSGGDKTLKILIQR